MAAVAFVWALAMMALPAVAGWVGDEAGCEIWLSEDADYQVEWQGDCAGGKADGPGLLELTRASPGEAGAWELTCECTARAGHLSETGSITGPDFGRYDGELADGLPSGAGIRVYKGGERYEGVWLNGKRHGQGEVISPRGWRYRGGFEQDLFSGHGRSEWRNGDWYEGAYLKGLRHGRGEYGAKSGGWKYQGNFVKDVREGAGTLILKSGHTFTGQFKKGKPDGKGTCLDPAVGKKGACRYSLGRFMEWLD